ncbi:filamentous hemagglutinin N-terminal domain-containing protein [Ectopseudomonas mendocina]|uniref:YDG domain-containing protein n=1 Tax=Ectopseudomonas mendocina TaxID=300 RepID=UPI001ADFF889|nr:YDG domain-containing protein [Pseudomonas mendocina]QTN46158.1 filamentous hemagglutinin N-terminal domain-containing protein [Pseudomonas mendocina]
MKRASLNHLYRLVWSDADQAFVAVAEHSTARGKRGGVVGVLAAVSLLGSGAVLAADLPTGASVVGGSGNISQNGSHMVVDQHTGKLVTNWNSFDIGADASVTFHQPGANSIALNRVIGGGNASQILGKLDANGQVWLLNPNGVVIGKGAEVNVGGLVASSLQISDQDFLAGKTTLSGGAGAGAVINQGSVNSAPGGMVALIGPQVGNSGSIHTPGGSTVLAAGDKVSLDFQGDGLVGVNVERGVLDAAVRNDGQISADGGLVSLSARSADALLSSVINNTGVIEAKGLVERGGRILLDGDAEGGLTQVAGTLDVSSEQGKGGSIVVTGERIAVADATLDASGATGGGTIKVGGGWQGQDATVANATQVTVERNVKVKADATQAGDGGTVVFWADGDNRFAGDISIRGGEQAGNGGKAEVSGKQTLHYAGKTDARASKGRTGDLLLDPTNIIVSGGNGTDGDLSASTGNVTVYEKNLEAQTANVLLQATTSIHFADLNQNGGDGTISMQDDVSFRAEVINSGNTATSISFANSSNTLEVSGSGSIYMQAGGTRTGSIDGVFNLVAKGAGVNPALADLPDHDVSVIGSGTPGAGSITLLGADGLTIAGSLSTEGGYIRLSSDSDTGGRGDLSITTPITTRGGNLYLSFGDTTRGSNTYNSVATLSGDITLGTGRLYFGDAMGTKGLGTSTGEKQLAGLLSLSGDVNFSTPLTMKGGASVFTDGSINFTSTVNLDTGNDLLTLRANNVDFTQATLQNLTTASIRLEPYDVTTNILLNSSSGSAGGGIFLDSNAPATDISKLVGIKNLTIGRADGTGTTTVDSSGFSFNANNNLSLLNGNIQVDGALSNSSGSGHVLAQAGVGDVVIGSGGTVTAQGSGDAVVLVAERNFVNQAGANAISASNGRWLTYSSSPLDDVRGGLDVAFKQYAAQYGDTVLGSGNGHLYRYAPKVTVELQGEVRKTYDGNAAASVSDANFAMSGAIDGDTIDVLSFGNAYYADKNAGAGKQVTVDNVEVSEATNGNVKVYGYQVDASSVSGDVGQIDRKVLTANADVAGKTYDGTTTANLSNVALVGVVAGDEGKVGTSGATGAFSDKNAGQDKSVTGSGIALTGEEADNYSFDTDAEIGKADIDRKVLTANAEVANKTYDGTTTANLSNVSLVGIVDGDEGKVSTSGTTGAFNDKNAGQDKSVTGSGIALTGEEADNYAFDTDAEIGKANIDRKVLTANADVADKTYDGTTTANLSNVSLVGIVDGDEGKVGTSGTTGAFSDKNAGQDKSVTGSGIALTGEEADNYAFDTDAEIGKANIDRKLLTANADVANKTYDGTNIANLSNVSLVGIVDGDEGKVGTSGTTGTFSDKNAGQDKSVTGSGIALTGEEADNYAFDSDAEIGKANIDRKLLTANADVAGKTYDGTTTANLSNVSLVGIVDGDEGKVSTSGTTGAFSDKNAGQNKSVTGSGIALTGEEADNYAFDSDAEIGKADIDRKVLTANADVADKTYDGTTTANLSNVSLVGIVDGDEGKVGTSGTTGTFSDKNAGQDKSVTGSGIALTGEEADNYAFDSDAEIGKADIDRKVLTANADVADKTYDGTTTANLSNVSLVGIVDGDEGKVGTSGTTGTFSDKNAGQNKSVTGSGIALTGEEAGNYAFDTDAQVGKADIDRKVLTANADVANKTYDGTNIANLSNVSLVGIVDGDKGKVGTSGTTGTFSDKNAGQNKSVTGSGIALTGEEAGNYAFDTDAQVGKADIDRKVLTANADVANKTYDGTTTANLSNVSLVGIVDGDKGKVGISGTGTFNDKNAGQDKSVTGSGITLTGKEANNYTFDTDAEIGKADIDRKVLTAIVDIADKPYDGRSTAIIRDIALDGIIDGDTVGATGNATFDSPAAGQGKTVSITDLQLLGDDAGNYQLSDQPVIGVASIQQPFLPPAGLINAPEGANGTGDAVKRPDNQLVVLEPASVQPLPSTVLFSDTPSLATSPVGLTTGDALVLQDAVLSGNGRMSLALADGRSEPAVRKSLDIYRTRAGEPLRSEGQYAATDLGSSITLELANTGSRQVPVLQRAGARSAEGSVALANGQRLGLQVTLMNDGVLLVQVPPLANDLDSDELAAYGLAVAKKRLGVSVRSIETVVVEHALRQAEVSSETHIEVASR